MINIRNEVTAICQHKEEAISLQNLLMDKQVDSNAVHMGSGQIRVTFTLCREIGKPINPTLASADDGENLSDVAAELEEWLGGET